MPPLKVPSLDQVTHMSDPVLVPDENVLAVKWTGEMLVGLDWKKLVEIARALAGSAGYDTGGTRLWADGMAEFTMKHRGASTAAGSVVRLSPWNRWMASGECIERFAAELKAHGGARGVYLAPGGISASARIEAARRGIELVDAEALAGALNRLPAAHSEFFHDLTLSGQPCVPSCPMCLRPLSQSSEGKAGEGASSSRLPDVSYHTSDIVADPIVARRIEVLQNCEVHFLREVRARDMFIQGVVIGDLICEGSLLLNPGGVVHGNVAARSVLVRPGAELHGETRILQGTLQTAEKAPPTMMWLCENVPSQSGCSRVVFLLH
jgi:hypothetical protein